MTQQSSVVVMFRAFVMLVCLIAIPLAALLGPSLPEVIKAAKEGRWPDLTKAIGMASSSEPARDEAPRFVPAPPPAAIPVEPAATAGNLSPQTPVPSGVVPASYESPTGPGNGIGESPEVVFPQDVADSAKLPVPSADALVQAQEKLRKLGATYYVLEYWGKEQNQFRFHCRMAVGGNPNYTRPFQAIENDPLQAIAKVVQEVEAWRAGRL
jgi:hypothetical protein